MEVRRSKPPRKKGGGPQKKENKGYDKHVHLVGGLGGEWEKRCSVWYDVEWKVKGYASICVFSWQIKHEGCTGNGKKPWISLGQTANGLNYTLTCNFTSKYTSSNCPSALHRVNFVKRWCLNWYSKFTCAWWDLVSNFITWKEWKCTHTHTRTPCPK